MPDANAYIKRIKVYGTEMVLETACRDADLTDDGYDKVWKAVTNADSVPAASKLRDRDAARQRFAA